jgi:hypothetical protein
MVDASSASRISTSHNPLHPRKPVRKTEEVTLASNDQQEVAHGGDPELFGGGVCAICCYSAMLLFSMFCSPVLNVGAQELLVHERFFNQSFDEH